jgi:rhodanese-related sulfurtransferase
VKKVLVEGLLVAVLGALLAFAANALSPRGLKLTRDYFPATGVVPLNSAGQTQTNSVSGTNAPSAFELLAEQFRQKGLQLLDSNHVSQLFNDPRYQQDLIVFIDARINHDEYLEGHIPGAYEFNYYRPEDFLPTVLPLCQAAQEIVIYCHGGECEDSQNAAIFLRDAGIPKEKLYVYAGGITEWVSNGLPVEIGPRKSGRMRPSKGGS